MISHILIHSWSFDSLAVRFPGLEVAVAARLLRGSNITGNGISVCREEAIALYPAALMTQNTQR